MTDQLTREELKLRVQGSHLHPRVERTMLDMVDTLALREQDLLTEAGSGISGAVGGSYASGVSREGDLIITRIVIDLTGLNSAATGDIIGKQAAANCHLGQITAAQNGTLIAGSMQCLEAPATGDTDIDLYSAVEATGVEDAAITGLAERALLASGAAWTNGRILGLTALPAANEYVYLTSGGAGADATYTAGKFVITLIGTA